MYHIKIIDPISDYLNMLTSRHLIKLRNQVVSHRLDVAGRWNQVNLILSYCHRK